MTSNVDCDKKPILQLFVIDFFVVSQPLNRKITKMVLSESLRLTHILKTILWKSFLFFPNDRQTIYKMWQIDMKTREFF